MPDPNTSDEARAQRVMQEIDNLLEETDGGIFSDEMAIKDLEALRVNLHRAHDCAANLLSSVGGSPYSHTPLYTEE